MELKTTKVYVPTNSEFTEKEGYLLTKEELERVIGDAFEMGEKKTKLPITTPNKQNYINQILK